MATRLGIWTLSIVLWAAISSFSSAAEQDKASDDARRRADALLVDVDGVIDRLKSAGRNDEARPLAEEAARLRGWLDGPFQRPASATPELHAVAVQTGGPFPPSYVAEENSLAEGYAEVRVGVVGRPVVLALSSQRGVHWRIIADDKVQIFAVITRRGDGRSLRAARRDAHPRFRPRHGGTSLDGREFHLPRHRRRFRTFRDAVA